MLTKLKTITVLLILLCSMSFAYGEFVVSVNDDIKSNMSQSTQSNNPSSIIVNKFSAVKDFSLASNYKDINICQCSVFADKITLYNTGNVADEYTISTNKEYSSLSTQRVILAPGEKVVVYNYIKAPCDESIQDLKVRVTDTSGKVKEMQQNINIGFCPNINASASVTQINTTPCQLSVMKFKIQNPLDFGEYYELQSDLLPELSKFSQDEIFIPSGRYANVLLYFNPTCDVFGDLNGNINVYTRNSNQEINIPIELNIKQTYNFSVTATKQNNICNYLHTKIPITITNHENFSNIFNVNMKKNKYLSLDNTSFELKPLSSKIIYLNAIPDLDANSISNVSINIESEFGKITKSLDLSLNITNCYEFDLSYNGPSKVCSDKEQLTFDIINTGTLENVTFGLWSSNPYLDIPSKITLKQGESKSIISELNFPDENNKYDFEVIASALNGTFEEKIDVNINSIKKWECYHPLINAHKIKTNYSKSSINLSVTNDGFKNASYVFVLNQSDWIQLEKDSSNIPPGQSDSLQMIFTPNNKLEEGKYLGDIFIIEKNSNTVYKKDLDIILYKKTVLQKLKSIFAEFSQNNTNTCYLVYDEKICNSEFFLYSKQGKDIIIDLDNYVKDPDNDTLIFSIIDNPNNMTYQFEENILTLTPEKGFIGFSSFQIMVDDQKGEKNLSPLFVIEIMDNSFRNKVFLFIILLCLVLILIIILLVSIIKRVAIRKAEDKKNNPPKLNIGKVKKKK